MTYLFCDPGFSNYGYAIFNPTQGIIHFDVIKTKQCNKTSKAQDAVRRITEITLELNRVIDQYGVTKVISELPHTGSKSAKASKAMMAATTLSTVIFTLWQLEVVWVTPNDIKRTIKPKGSVDKKEIMQYVCDLYNWNITYKQVNTKNKIRHDAIYHIHSQKVSCGKFEHIADAIMAYHTAIRLKLI
jgi:Holliday junction resolvasome RuvABC endonuclease subunit